MKRVIGEVGDLDGYRKLKKGDQKIISEIFETGDLAPGAGFMKPSKGNGDDEYQDEDLLESEEEVVDSSEFRLTCRVKNPPR